MSPSDPLVHALLASAQDRIRATLDAAIVEVANNLLVLMKSASMHRERGQLAVAQIYVLENREGLVASFASALRERIDEDVAAQGETKSQALTTDWQTIGLVDEGQIEEKISFERIGQMIAHRSEAELRELDAYMSSVLGHGWADPTRNPFRGSVLGSALHKAIEKLTDETDTQKIFARELYQAMANAMPACYRGIAADLQQSGVKKIDLAMRPADEFSARPSTRAGSTFGELRKQWEASWRGRPPTELPPGSWKASILGRLNDADPLPSDVDGATSAKLLDRLIRGGMQGDTLQSATAAANLELMGLLRRLNGGAGHTGKHDALPGDTGHASSSGEEPREDFSTRPRVPLGVAYEQPPSNGLSGLMAANLIRAHRAELQQVTRGKLDHLVIEVVGSLFDQILSDARVPPEAARQLARLQLPVLRAALTDGTFFSSRRHPVRRFINRVASLACAFDSFESGPAKQLLDRMREIVDEIVEGDFEQLDLYEAKLVELERFVADLTHAEIRASAAAATLRGKELEWRVQQRFSEQLRAALEPLVVPAFLRNFLIGAWAQAIVMASRRDGDDAAYPMQLRSTGTALVMSVQPKRSIADRKAFVARLPALMAELTQAMKFVDWPEAAQDEFFGQLITHHAGSLKGAPMSELDHNLMVRNLEATFRTPVPSAEEAAEPVADATALPPIEQRFSLEEELAIGLVSDHDVDWARAVAAAGAVAPAPVPAKQREPVEALATAGGAVTLPTIDAAAPKQIEGAAPSEPIELPESPELAAGPQLRDHLQLGFSYQLNLKSEWQKVRLTYMSPARSLFLFSHGAKNRETISMTARTLGRLCAAGRMRAFENAFLVERATQRARQQLAMSSRGAATH